MSASWRSHATSPKPGLSINTSPAALQAQTRASAESSSSVSTISQSTANKRSCGLLPAANTRLGQRRDARLGYYSKSQQGWSSSGTLMTAQTQNLLLAFRMTKLVLVTTIPKSASTSDGAVASQLVAVSRLNQHQHEKVPQHQLPGTVGTGKNC